MNQPTDAEDARVAEIFTAIAIEAADVIRTMDCRSVSRSEKADHSPVTAADTAAQATIIRALAEKLPGIPVVSEEAVGDWHDQRPPYTFVLVDPLDGTREFLAARDEYTVNIALVRGGTPVVGVVAAPALGLIWTGAAGRAERLRVSADGAIAERTAIRTRPAPSDTRVAAVSRSHYEAASAAFIEKFAPVEMLPCGSALKFCRVAEGAADIYPRLAPTSEWDVAAGHALVVAAGGTVIGPECGALAYGTPDFRVPGFVAWGDPALASQPIRSGRS